MDETQTDSGAKQNFKCMSHNFFLPQTELLPVRYIQITVSDPAPLVHKQNE